MTSTETLKRPAEALDIQWVGHILNHLRPTLPIQNPMPFFVHNNPLQYWEQFPFAKGMENAILTYENSLEQKSRIHWRELEDFVLPIVIAYFDQGLSRWNLEEQKQINEEFANVSAATFKYSTTSVFSCSVKPRLNRVL